jgi:hypothetical protein
MPVGANPVTFLLHKVQALGELPPTLSATFEVPLNPESELALNTEDFPSAVCLQCHALENRVVSPTRGIRIPYHGHEAVGMSCTMCHNRAAHSELGDWLPALVDPQTAAPSRKHANFMSMSGCFRCHDLAPAALAKGDCTLCHSDDFDLRPQDHKIDSWMDVHDILAQREADRVLATVEHYAKEGENAVASWQRKVRDIQDLMKLADGADNRYLHTPQNRPLVQQDGVWRCGMCHQQQDFCQPCHLQNGISRQRETARELR